MNFNLKEISWQDAEKLEPGSKLWVGQTREKAVEGIISRPLIFQAPDTAEWNIQRVAALNLTPYIPTPDPVDISPSEAAARMVEGLPVEYRRDNSYPWQAITDKNWAIFGIADYEWRIPACPPKQKLTIEVDAGVEVPDEFGIWALGEVTAKVIHREAK